MQYFSNFNNERSWPKESIISEMLEHGLTETTVWSAKRTNDIDYFFCKETQEVGEKGECGKNCHGYKPMNDKSGRCIHYGFCYEPDQEFVLNINGRLTKK